MGGRGPQGADGRMRREHANWVVGGRTGLVGRTGGLADWWMGWTGRRGGGPGFKRRHSSTPFHSWAPSPLASSESECAGCLGVQWGLEGFPRSSIHAILNMLKLTCLV